MNGEQTVDEAAEAVLVAHQRATDRSCLCGWAKLGRSHPKHQVAKLRQAGLLSDDAAEVAPVSADPPGEVRHAG
ncbi:hypothetical protein [Actinoplanes sp. URMC 104]|uniref:hypothetical protein n=1 Tax=Actinoplanes sp. URMC 104 TaxID=3423409 RepID=UPI003F1DF617